MLLSRSLITVYITNLDDNLYQTIRNKYSIHLNI